MKTLSTLFDIFCFAFVLFCNFSASIRLEATEIALQKEGDILGTFAVGKNPVRALFDATHIWVTNINRTPCR